MNSDNAVADFLARSSVYRTTGLAPSGGTGVPGTLQASSRAAEDKGDSPFHPDSAMFWLAVIGTLVIVGAVGVTGSGRVGPVKAGFTAGKK